MTQDNRIVQKSKKVNNSWSNLIEESQNYMLMKTLLGPYGFYIYIELKLWETENYALSYEKIKKFETREKIKSIISQAIYF